MGGGKEGRMEGDSERLRHGGGQPVCFLRHCHRKKKTSCPFPFLTSLPQEKGAHPAANALCDAFKNPLLPTGTSAALTAKRRGQGEKTVRARSGDITNCADTRCTGEGGLQEEDIRSKSEC